MDEQIRRLRRLVAGDGPAPAPRPVEARHEERFRRVLGLPRRAAALDERRAGEAGAGSAMPPFLPPAPASAFASASAAAAPAAPVPRAADAGQFAQPAPAFGEPSSTRQALAPATASGPGALAARSPRTEGSRGAKPAPPPRSQIKGPGEQGPHDAAADSTAAEERLNGASPAGADAGLSRSQRAVMMSVGPSSDAAPVSAIVSAIVEADWSSGVADTVTALCQASEPSFHSWTIQVPLDSAALPHTELRMTFSRHHLLLRFSTQSTQSFTLISAHQSRLRELLAQALPGDRHIDIELT